MHLNSVFFPHSPIRLCFNIFYFLNCRVDLQCCVSFCCTAKWYKKVNVSVAQAYLALCNPMDCSPSVSSVHGILQARILESSWPRDQTWVSCITGGIFTIWATRKPMYVCIYTHTCMCIYIYIHTHIYTFFSLFFLVFFSIMVYYSISNIIPYAIQ